MSHIHASAQHLAGRMQVFTGDPQAFLISLSERQVGKLARRTLLPKKEVPCPSHGSKHFTFYCVNVGLWAARIFTSYYVQNNFFLGLCVDLPVI